MVISRQRLYHLYEADLRVLRCHWKPKRPKVPPFEGQGIIKDGREGVCGKENEDSASNTLSP